MNTEIRTQNASLSRRLICAAVFGTLAMTPAMASAQEDTGAGLQGPEEETDTLQEDNPLTDPSERDAPNADNPDAGEEDDEESDEVVRPTETPSTPAKPREALPVRPDANLTSPRVNEVSGTGENVALFGANALDTRLSFNSRVVSIDNVDFRPIDDDNVQDIYETDDRRSFGVNNMNAGFTFYATDQAKLDVGLRHNSLWGGGRLRQLNNDNMIIVDNLFLSWSPSDTSAIDFKLRMGRQYFEIGGAGNFGGTRRDYYFWDVVDGVTFDLGFGKAGKLRVLAVDFAGTQFRPDEIDFATRQDTSSSEINFRGDSLTIRSGLIYENTEAVEGLEVRAFGFYADLGGSVEQPSTTADLCFGGGLCNFSDSDFTWMAGARAGYFFENDDETVKVGGYGEFAQSGGVDRKDTRVGLYDVNTSGSSFGAGLSGDFDLGSLKLGVGAQFFRANGPQYAADGVQFNHGFVGMKGAHIGGGLMDDVSGWHPSAYIDGVRGVRDFAHNQDRTSGTQSIYAGFDMTVKNKVKVDAGVWFLKDAGSTNFNSDTDALEANDIPWGYSLADLQAQERLGKSLGTELDLGLAVNMSDKVDLVAQGAYFLPGEFYKIELSRTAGSALGSTDPANAWLVMGGLSLALR